MSMGAIGDVSDSFLWGSESHSGIRREQNRKYPDFGELPSTCSGPESAYSSRVVASLPGRSSERSETVNQHPGSRIFINHFHYNG